MKLNAYQIGLADGRNGVPRNKTKFKDHLTQTAYNHGHRVAVAAMARAEELLKGDSNDN